MARVDDQQYQVLEAFASYLQTALTLHARQCYIAIDPRRPMLPMGGDYWVAVSLGGGNFDDALMTGSVRDQPTEDALVTVTGYSRVHLDDSNRDTHALGVQARGILRIKYKILNAMAGKELSVVDDVMVIATVGADVGVSTQEFVARSLITPVNASAPEVGYLPDEDDSMGISMVSLSYAIPFDWDLTS